MTLIHAYSLAAFSTAFMLALLGAAANDVRFLRVPHAAVLLIVVLFVLKAAIFLTAAEIGDHTVLAMAFLVGGLCFWFLGLLSGGDVRLLAASGLWIGPEHAAGFLFMLTFAAVLLGVSLLLLRKRARIAQNLGLLDQMASAGGYPFTLAVVPAAFLFA